MNITDENKEPLISLLVRFYEAKMFDSNKEKTVRRVAEEIIKDEIAMQKGMQEYYDYLEQENKKNRLLLKGIKAQKGAAFYKHLLDIIEESEGITGVAEIVDTPTGEFQEEKRGRYIKGIWIEQWSVGMESDSWNGHVCVELYPNRYFKFSYSM